MGFCKNPHTFLKIALPTNNIACITEPVWGIIDWRGRCVFNGKFHFAFGVMMLLFMWNGGLFLNPITFLIGAVLPDCDIRSAPAGRILPLWIWFRHRGIVHSWWFLLIFSGITALIWNWWAGLSLGAGYFTHLMMDACTPSGIRWLAKRKRKKPSR